MRVTQLEIGRNLLTDLEKLNRSFVDVSRQYSSGKKLNNLGDSPLGSADLVDLTEQALRLESYSFNITASKYQLSSAESVLNRANNAFVSIHALASEAANEPTNTEGRKAILTEIEKLREELISIGNTQVDGKYIFAGTLVDKPPFDPAGSGLDGSVYKGNQKVNSIPVGDGVKVVAGVSGDKVLGAVFKKVDEIIEAISNSVDGSGDVSAIGAALEGFKTSMDELSQARGQIGVSLSMVQRLSELLSARNVVLKEQRSIIEDANILEVSVRINQLQTAISAAISGGGAILQQNTLFDIIG